MNKILALITLLQSGCWTIYSVGSALPEPPLVYGGIRSWGACITHYDTSAILGVYTILDVPLSFALDTLLFPITFLWNIFA